MIRAKFPRVKPVMTGLGLATPCTGAAVATGDYLYAEQRRGA